MCLYSCNAENQNLLYSEGAVVITSYSVENWNTPATWFKDKANHIEYVNNTFKYSEDICIRNLF